MRSLIRELRESGMAAGDQEYSAGFNAFRGPEPGRGMGVIRVGRRYDGSELAKGDPREHLKKMIKVLRKAKWRKR